MRHIDARTSGRAVNDFEATRRLADVLAEREDLDALTARANAGDIEAARQPDTVMVEVARLDGEVYAIASDHARSMTATQVNITCGAIGD